MSRTIATGITGGSRKRLLAAASVAGARVVVVRLRIAIG
jgi:hypothetical protein